MIPTPNRLPSEPSIEATMSRLESAGWSPNRSIDISPYLAVFAKQGIEVFPAAEACLRSFGNLIIHQRMSPDAPGDYVAFDLEDAVGGITAVTLRRTASTFGV